MARALAYAHVDSYELINLWAIYYAPNDRYFVRLWGDNLTDDRHADLYLAAVGRMP